MGHTPKEQIAEDRILYQGPTAKNATKQASTPRSTFRAVRDAKRDTAGFFRAQLAEQRSQLPEWRALRGLLMITGAPYLDCFYAQGHDSCSSEVSRTWAPFKVDIHVIEATQVLKQQTHPRVSFECQHKFRPQISISNSVPTECH